MRYLSLVLLTLMLSVSAQAQIKLSSEASISLLTCSPGGELYSLFGHSAIRVHDPLRGIDSVFNYGTFDFDTPNFYLKFAKGDLNYMLTYGNYARFLRSYQYEKRSVWEQQINFNEEEKQNFFNALVTNTREENRYYRYDFLFDNCATRIRDIIEANVDGELVYDQEKVEDYTYREMLHLYEVNYPWIGDGLDIILGMKTDDDANAYNQMFLPDYLMLHLGHAKVVNGESKALLGEPKTILSFNNQDNSTGIKPALVFWLLFILSALVAYRELKRKQAFVFLNRLFLLLTGVVGCLIFFLWFLSRHSVTGENFNMLWAIPFNVFIALGASWFYKAKVFKVYLIFLIACAAIPVLFFWMIPQHLPAMIYPLCLLLITRYATWYYTLTAR